MITKKEAGTVNGKAVAQYTLENENGLAMTFYTYGGIIQSLLVKDRQGIARDVELGFDTLDEYVKAACYYGAPIGRYANRINQGKIVLDGDTIQLAQNNFGHCLHGGPKGWQYQVYNANPIDSTTLELPAFHRMETRISRATLRQKCTFRVNG